MGNTNSSSVVTDPLGGVSPVHPIGKFVRVIRPDPVTIEQEKRQQASAKKQEEKEEEPDGDSSDSDNSDDGNSSEKKKTRKAPNVVWSDELEKYVGQVGIVLGGGEKVAENVATVGFSMKPIELKVAFRFKSAWLQPVSTDSVDIDEKRLLRLYMQREMRKLMSSVFEIKTVMHTLSDLGACGSLVRVRETCNTKKWADHQKQTLGQYGVVIGGIFKMLGQNLTLVAFPEPICWRYACEDSELIPVMPEDDMPSEGAKKKLLALRDMVKDVRQEYVRESAEKKMLSSIEKLSETLDKMSNRLELIEQRLVHLNTVSSTSSDGQPRLTIEAPPAKKTTLFSMAKKQDSDSE